MNQIFRMKTSFSLIWLLPFFVLWSCTAPHLVRDLEEKKAVIPQTVRVAVLSDITHLQFRAKDALLFSGNDRIRMPSYTEIHVNENCILLDGRKFPTPVVIKSPDQVMINGRMYYGDLEIVARTLINRVPMDEYLRGVVSSEIPSNWHIEALKAQVVVSRTYVYKKMLQNRDSLFDVNNTELHQKYNLSENNQSIDRAISETRDLVIFYRDEPIEAFFHSCSGGRTESSRDIFQKDLPYLRSIPDPYSRGEGCFSWSITLNSMQITDALRKIQSQKSVPIFGDVRVRDIRIYRRTSSGRVKEFALTLESGETYIISGNSFRLAVDPGSFKSLLIDAINKERRGSENYFTINGRGYGHGVGMSQWGAKEMAERGFNFTQILSHYFPGTMIGRLSF
ncbi:MAG: SpoIID/LytB domain-containing protein [Spirochaetota bacterium]